VSYYSLPDKVNTRCPLSGDHIESFIRVEVQKSSMPTLTDVKGVSDSRAEDLREEGYNSVDDIATSDEDELTEVSGIGSSTASDLVESAQDVLQEEHGVEVEDEPEQPEPGVVPAEDDDVTIEDLEDINNEEPDGYNEPRDEEDVTAKDDDPEPQEVDTSPDLYDVTISLPDNESYDYLILALVELKVQRVSASHEQSRIAAGLLDEFRPLAGSGEVTISLDSDELNTLHSAVKQVATRYQGSNDIDAFDSLKHVEEQVQEARREYLF
jgi:hypothetical protein